MPIRNTITDTRVPVHIWTDEIAPNAVQQLRNIAQLPFVHHHVAAMPDAHLGIGATVGSVIPTRAAIIPASVGVDIGCGMMAVETSLNSDQLPDNLGPVRSAVEAAVPVGFDMLSENRISKPAARAVKAGMDRVLDRAPRLAAKQSKDKLRWARQIGTLGGGNHFIELCLDERQQVWVMLHSGSRGIGNQIGMYYIAAAKEEIHRRGEKLPDKNLAWLDEGTELFEDYLFAVEWAQDYAARNREVMMDNIFRALRRVLPGFETRARAINCHHNYVARERHYGDEVYVTRKGAIRAGQGELGIIPGSMGARSYIVRGKGSAEAFLSCAHGAGRKMSRTAAKKRFSRQDLIDQTRGVECRKDKGVIDEIPGAYKDIDEVMANQEELVDIVATLKQVVCVKG